MLWEWGVAIVSLLTVVKPQMATLVQGLSHANFVLTVSAAKLLKCLQGIVLFWHRSCNIQCINLNTIYLVRFTPSLYHPYPPNWVMDRVP